MSEREVMGYQRAGVDNNYAQEQFVVLRLNRQEDDGGNIDDDYHLMEQPCAYLVLIAQIGVMHYPYECQ